MKYERNFLFLNICPLYKKNDKTLAYNYRPVSFACVPCKLLGHIVCSNIMAHLDEHRRHHALRKRHSWEIQLTVVGLRFWTIKERWMHSYWMLRMPSRKPNFSDQFKKIVKRYIRVGYHLDIMRQSAYVV